MFSRLIRRRVYRIQTCVWRLGSSSSNSNTNNFQVRLFLFLIYSFSSFVFVFINLLCARDVEPNRMGYFYHFFFHSIFGVSKKKKRKRNEKEIWILYWLSDKRRAHMRVVEYHESIRRINNARNALYGHLMKEHCTWYIRVVLSHCIWHRRHTQ